MREESLHLQQLPHAPPALKRCGALPAVPAVIVGLVLSTLLYSTPQLPSSSMHHLHEAFVHDALDTQWTVAYNPIPTSERT